MLRPPEPPPDYAGTPHHVLLPPRTALWRVHHERSSATAFRSKPSDSVFTGGRFDATSDEKYPFYYAAEEQTTALSERLLRDASFDRSGYRILPRTMLVGLVLSQVETVSELCLISLLDSRDFAAIGQDGWLTRSENVLYPYTRSWAHWLRRQDPAAQGLIWQSNHDLLCRALMLFGDRCGADAQLVPTSVDPVRLDTRDGILWLNGMLGPYAGVDPS